MRILSCANQYSYGRTQNTNKRKNNKICSKLKDHGKKKYKFPCLCVALDPQNAGKCLVNGQKLDQNLILNYLGQVKNHIDVTCPKWRES